jgi:sodium-coupled neutral amino acid transporter 9
MIGTAVVSLPWAFQESGAILGLIITTASFLISFYTCKLIIDMAGTDPDYSDTLRKYYGKCGYYTGLISPALIIVGAVSVYFVIMTELMYPVLLAIYAWISGTDPELAMDPTFKKFSSSYCALFLFVVLVLICMKKDISIFLKIGSFGVIFIIILMIFIICVGVIAFTNTEFYLGSAQDAYDMTIEDWQGDMRYLVLFNANFSPLAGILCAGYFLHTCSLPIIRSSRNPEKNSRDVFLGYFFVYLSYAICGVLGYIGFLGTDFTDYFVTNWPNTALRSLIDQNCLNMFDYKNVAAFLLRICVFMLLFTTYPLVAYFLNDIILKLFFRNSEPSKLTALCITLLISFIPLLFALFYPSIGTILGYVGALAGFGIIYVFPVLVHLKYMKTKIQNPLLAEAIKMNEISQE